MQDTRILPRKYRRDARHNAEELNRAMVASSGITAHGRRRMARLDWEGNRSPSRLGRAGERAQQVSDFITPTAASATALVALASGAFDLYVKYRAWRERPQPNPSHTGGEYDQRGEPPF